MEYKQTELGVIPQHWEIVSIKDIGEVVGGGTPSTKVKEYYGEGISWITPKDLSGYSKKRIVRGARNITELGLKNSSAKILPINTVLLSSRAPIGYVAIAAKELTTNQGFKSIICNEEKVIPEFLYYILKMSKESLEAISSGSTFKEVSGTAVKSFRIILPPLEEQKEIVRILSSLDEKIELNEEIINNLELLSQTLYKRWFVDFEFPNEVGEPYKSSGGEMTESELGNVPIGWDVKMVGEVARIIRGASPRPIQDFIASTGMPWVKISDANASKSMYINSTKEFIKENGILKSRTVTPGTLILSNSATPGIPKFMTIEACVHDGWLIFNDYQTITKEFLYLFLKSERESILNLSNGSVFRNLKTDILKKYKILVPEEKTLKYAQPVFITINNNIKNAVLENIKLKELLETLQPKLLRGEVELPVGNGGDEHVSIP